MRRRAIVALLVLAGALLAAAAAQARLPQSARELRAARIEHRALPPQTQLHLATRVIHTGASTLAFLRSHPHAGTYRGRAVIAHNHSWLVAFGGREKRDALARLAVLEARRLAHGDWSSVAVPFADRIWPGTGWWLLACSSSEGGHGGWVWNTAGSGAGGWMQFMSGTFYSYAPSASAEARRRGFALPSSILSWDSTTGQAVTAAYMRANGLDRGQWSGSRC